jgi:hypothetical protein
LKEKSVTLFIKANVALKRITEFLLKEEIDTDEISYTESKGN